MKIFPLSRPLYFSMCVCVCISELNGKNQLFLFLLTWKENIYYFY